MPSRNRIKKYLPATIYHIYNRGIDGREIFKDSEDYEYFLELLKRYLEEFSPEVSERYKTIRPYLARHRQQMNLHRELDLLCYCLLPDHFHLLIRQNTADGITKLMRRVFTNYVMYFNKKNKRHGTLFENVYRAVIVPDTEQLIDLTKYIHLNPVSRVVRRYGPVATVSTADPEYYMYSSYKNFLGLKSDKWLRPEIILEKMKIKFPTENDYATYTQRESNHLAQSLKNLILEEVK